MFSLNNTDNSFKSRQANVFDCLGELEKQTEDKREDSEFKVPQPPSPPPDAKSCGHSRRGRREDFRNSNRARQTNQDRSWGRHSQPREPRNRNGSRKDPNKWVKYDLSDVSSDQLSERSNSAAAFSFLEERRKLREGTTEDETHEEGGKIQFHKPKSKTTTTKQKEDSDASSFVGGKRRMQEYVVGAQPKKAKKNDKNKSRVASCSAVSLSHLDDEEEDVEEDG